MQIQLNENNIHADPIAQLGEWYRHVMYAGVADADAMSLCTIGETGRPSCRIVFMKDFSDEGISFFTNYNSRKAKEIQNNPNGALNFFWKEFWMQVRIEGKIFKLNSEMSDAYFMTRPRESRVGAWASPQSQVIKDRAELEAMVARKTEYFLDKEVLRPEWWGGYLLVPDYFEFFLGRDSRLHDRICYKHEDGYWKISRLAP